MEEHRSVAERRDVIIRRVLEDMIALQREGFGVVGATPNESGRRHPLHEARRAGSEIGSG